MKTHRISSAIFMIAAIYDGVLGATFLFASGTLFERLGVPPPNHPGYVQFPAALLLVFTVLFITLAMDPVKNRNLIPYAILLKISYCGVVLFHWLTGGIPTMWKPFCLIDFVFLIVFIGVWKSLSQESRHGHDSALKE